MENRLNEPYLALYVKDGVLYFTKKLLTENSPRVILDVEVNEIISDDFDVAAKKLGETALGILSLWHKNEFKDWGISSPPQDVGLDDYGIAHCLIERSVSGKTSAHVQSIEVLLRQEAGKSEDVKRFFEDSWPIIRMRLESFHTR